MTLYSDKSTLETRKCSSIGSVGHRISKSDLEEYQMIQKQKKPWMRPSILICKMDFPIIKMSLKTPALSANTSSVLPNNTEIRCATKFWQLQKRRMQWENWKIIFQIAQKVDQSPKMGLQIEHQINLTQRRDPHILISMLIKPTRSRKKIFTNPFLILKLMSNQG